VPISSWRSHAAAERISRYLRPTALAAILFIAAIGSQNIPEVRAWVAERGGEPGWQVLGYLILLGLLLSFFGVWLLAVIHALANPRRSLPLQIGAAILVFFSTPLGAILYTGLEWFGQRLERRNARAADA
jgi:H+/Cl- antiporter ClcA